MKNIYLSLSLLIGVTSFAQGENDNWYFGNNGGVKFSTAMPTVLYGGQINTPQATATISDKNGNLLFYTNGNQVWNRQHQIMVNGNDLLGTTDTQQVVIAPYPGSTSLYYIFAMGKYGSGGYQSTYSLVDMSIGTTGTNGLPLGAVTAIKNVPLLNELGTPFLYSSENAALVAHADNKSYWLLFYNGENLYSYRIDSGGFNPIPVVNNLPVPVQVPAPYPLEAVAHIRVSKTFNDRPYSNLISISRSKTDTTRRTSIPRVFSFDNNTGTITNDYFWSTVSFGFTSTEFSEDGTILYGISGNGTINNFDLTWIPGMPNLDRVIYWAPGTAQNAYLQKATNGEIYAAIDNNPSANFLGRITDQNSKPNAAFITNDINVGSPVRAGLPPLVPLIDAAGSGCWENLTLSVPETTSITRQVSYTITTNNLYRVNSGQTVNLKANNYVLMLPNTTISSNSVFKAEIDGCTPSPIVTNSARIAKQEPIVIFNEAKALLVTIAIYPNPASDITKISLTKGEIVNLTVYTKEGRMIFNSNINDTTYNLDVSAFEKGIYLLTLTTDKGEILTEKIIKN